MLARRALFFALVCLMPGCRKEAEPIQAPPELRAPWVELGPSEINLEDGTRVVTGARYRFVGNNVVFRFDYRKVGDPARSGASIVAALQVDGAELEGGAPSWSMGAEGPDVVERRLRPEASNVPGIIKVEYSQRAESPGRRPTESQTRLCFVTGAEASRVARPNECVQ